MSLLAHFYAFMTALSVALMMVPFLRRWALERGNVDLPDAARKVHTEAMPRLGGVAIFLAFLFSTVIFAPIEMSVRGIMAGGLVVFATGLIDDLEGLSPRRKFAGQILACLTTILVGKLYLVNLGDLFGFGAIVLPSWFGVPFTVFAVVGVINAINLIDGLDGLAGGVSVLALAGFLTLGLIDGDPVTSLLSAALVGGLLGFLKYNFYPARIFMGDAGSLTLGFLLGFLAVHLTQHPGATISPVAPVLILGLPLIDAVWVMGRRIVLGQSPFVADRTHMHHKLLNLGFEHRFTVLIMYGISLFWAVMVILLKGWPEYALLAIYAVSCLLGYLLLRHLLKHPELLGRFMRDADEPIRQTVVYGRLRDFAIVLNWPLKLLLAGYAMLALVSVWMHNVTRWEVSLLLLAAGVVLRLMSHQSGLSFAMLVVYASSGIAAYEVWDNVAPLVAGVSVKEAGDLLLGVMALLAVFRLVFRKNGEFFLTTVDFLVLGVCTFLAIASQTGVHGINLFGPLFRCVLLLLVIRTTIAGSSRDQRIVKDAMLVFLLFVTANALLG